MDSLHAQFEKALTIVEVNGEKRKRAIAAHTEIQSVLNADHRLRACGISTRLIGSYGRQTAIYPGKDVDVFARFEALNTSASPESVYNAVESVLVDRYGHVRGGGRVTPQARSIKVDFPDINGVADFAVDAVPAVRNGARWAIPATDRSLWNHLPSRWITTDPERFSDLSTALNQAPESPSVKGQGAYKPTVKLMRQIREVHLVDRKPGGLYVEFAVYDVWRNGLVSGSEWGVLLAASLLKVAYRFSRAPSEPLLDPGLNTPVNPALSEFEWGHAATVFHGLAQRAEEALGSSRCAAAKVWREILGQNVRGEVFRLPPGCDAAGFALSAAGLGGLGMASGQQEASGFG